MRTFAVASLLVLALAACGDDDPPDVRADADTDAGTDVDAGAGTASTEAPTDPTTSSSAPTTASAEAPTALVRLSPPGAFDETTPHDTLEGARVWTQGSESDPGAVVVSGVESDPAGVLDPELGIPENQALAVVATLLDAYAPGTDPDELTTDAGTTRVGERPVVHVVRAGPAEDSVAVEIVAFEDQGIVHYAAGLSWSPAAADAVSGVLAEAEVS